MSDSNPVKSSRPWVEPVRVLKYAVWFGILTAWVELGILGYRKYIQHRPSFGMPERVSLFADYRNLWTVPLAESLTLLMPAIIVAIVAFRWASARTLFAGVALAGFLSVVSILFNFTWLHPAAVFFLALGAGVQIARAVTPRANAFHRLVGRTLGGMVALVVLSGAGSTVLHRLQERGSLSKEQAAAGAPNVLLIILDTVRSFSMSAYGYERETSPRIAGLAKRGVLFDRAYSTAPWTLPSHASMFTGRFPYELSGDMQSSLDVTWPTLAETMTQRGYATAGFVANIGYTSAETGLARGFAHYEDRVLSRGSLINASSVMRIATNAPLVSKLIGMERFAERKDADRINTDFLRWLPSVQDRPFFVFLNYFDAHRPYHAPRPYDRKYVSSRARVRQIMQTAGKKKLPDDASQLLTGAYDGALTYLDDRIGKLIDALEQRGALKNTIVIITSDHGEQFGEHGLYYHANSLYPQLLRVPLVIFGGDRVPVGARVSPAVSLRDLAPTVLDLVGGGVSSPFPGRSLSRFWEDSAAATAELPLLGAELGATAQLIQDFAPNVRGMRGVLVDNLHYIKSGENLATGQIREELYDVVQDSLETQDLMETETGKRHLARLRATLDSILPPETDVAGRAAKARAAAAALAAKSPPAS